MDIIEVVAHELTEQALDIHRKAAGNEQPVPRADMKKLAADMKELAKVTWPLLELPLMVRPEDRQVQKSMALIVEVKRRVSAMPLNGSAEAMILLALKDLIKNIFPHAGLGW